MEKCCTKCKEIKPLEEFGKDKNQSDGLYPSCKPCRKLRASTYYIENKDKVKQGQKKWYSRSYIKSNRVLKTKEQKQAVRKNCTEKWKLENPRYYTDRYRDNVNHRIKMCLRSRLLLAIKKNQKSGSAVRDLGCTIEELKQHLESKFQPGMSWGNYGRYGWHIDHIIPLSAFDLCDPVQLKQACHYTNLQPLWAEDNLSKSNKVL